MIVVDSSVWIDFFNGVSTPQTQLMRQKMGQEPIIVGDLVLTEVLQGFRSDRDFALAKTALQTFFVRPMGGEAISLAAAENYRQLRRLGVTVRKTIDVFIATFCIENGHSLLHSDRDFDAMEQHLGLNVL